VSEGSQRARCALLVAAPVYSSLQKKGEKKKKNSKRAALFLSPHLYTAVLSLFSFPPPFLVSKEKKPQSHLARARCAL
jgi:hypothetical protein